MSIIPGAVRLTNAMADAVELGETALDYYLAEKRTKIGAIGLLAKSILFTLSLHELLVPVRKISIQQLVCQKELPTFLRILHFMVHLCKIATWYGNSERLLKSLVALSGVSDKNAIYHELFFLKAGVRPVYHENEEGDLFKVGVMANNPLVSQMIIKDSSRRIAATAVIRALIQLPSIKRQFDLLRWLLSKERQNLLDTAINSKVLLEAGWIESKFDDHFPETSQDSAGQEERMRDWWLN